MERSTALETIVNGVHHVYLVRKTYADGKILYAVCIDVAKAYSNGDLHTPSAGSWNEVAYYEHLDGALDLYYEAIEVLTVAHELGHGHSFGVDRSLEPTMQFGRVTDGNDMNDALTSYMDDMGVEHVAWAEEYGPAYPGMGKK